MQFNNLIVPKLIENVGELLWETFVFAVVGSCWHQTWIHLDSLDGLVLILRIDTVTFRFIHPSPATCQLSFNFEKFDNFLVKILNNLNNFQKSIPLTLHNVITWLKLEWNIKALINYFFKLFNHWTFELKMSIKFHMTFWRTIILSLFTQLQKYVLKETFGIEKQFYLWKCFQTKAVFGLFNFLHIFR